jgi:hypothetical protein
MKALVLAKYCKPSDYNIATVPTPRISKPDEVLVKVHSASINPLDVKMASGLGKMMDPHAQFAIPYSKINLPPIQPERLIRPLGFHIRLDMTWLEWSLLLVRL